MARDRPHPRLIWTLAFLGIVVAVTVAVHLAAGWALVACVPLGIVVSVVALAWLDAEGVIQRPSSWSRSTR